MAALEALDLGAVQWFFQRVYRPDNASLVLVGDFDRGQVKQLIERYFAGIVNPAVPRLTTQAQPVRFQGSARARVRASGRSDTLYALWTLPPGALDARAAEIAALAFLLDARVHEQLAHEHEVPNTIRVSSVRSSSGDRFTIAIAAAERGNLELAEQVLDEQLASLRGTPLDGAAFTDLRRSLRWRLLRERETALYRALQHALDRPVGSAQPFDPGARAAQIDALTPEALMTAARELLPAERRLLIEQITTVGIGGQLLFLGGELFSPRSKR